MLVGPVWGRRKLEKAWRRMPADAKHGGALCKDWIRSWRFQGWSLRADLDEQQHHWWQKLMERFVLCFMAPWLWRMLQAHSMTCRSMEGKGDGKVWRQRRLDPWHGKNFAGEHDYVDTDWDSHSQSLTGCTAYEEETDMAFNTEETYGQGLIVWQGSRRLPRHKHCVALWVWIRFWYGEACALAAESLQQLEQELTCWGSKEAWLPSPMSLRHLRISVFSGERRSQRWKARRATSLRHHHGCQSRRSPASWSSTARSRLTALNYMQLETCDLYENILPSGILDGLGGVPKSSICAEAISQGWFQPLERQGFLQVTDEFTTTDASKTFFASMERYFAMRVLKHGRGGRRRRYF